MNFVSLVHRFATAAVVIREGRVLLTWRSSGPYAGKIECPGGEVERYDGTALTAVEITRKFESNIVDRLHERTGVAIQHLDGRICSRLEDDMCVHFYRVRIAGQVHTPVLWADARVIERALKTGRLTPSTAQVAPRLIEMLEETEHGDTYGRMP